MTSESPFPDQEIWFFTGSQDLYGEETLQQVAEQSQRVAATLDDAAVVPVRIVWKPVLKEPAAIRRAMGEANESAACIGVITWMHTFSPAKMWIAGLDALRKPLLHLHTQADAALPWATIDMDFMNLNQAAHGDREYGYALTRLRVPRTTVAGHASNPAVQARVGGWARAAVAAADARSLKLARFGDNMRNVAVTEGDKVEAQLRVGVSVNTYWINDLAAVVDAVEDTAVDAVIAEYLDLYSVAEDLRPGGDRHHSVRYQATLEVALRTFLTDGGFGAFTTNFEDLG
ncbi:MAG: L-arabinose isomerase, partial [Actinobacteria bacterium]|nr:L-arabinose isomerase [Actinomycetota bacterium]